MAHELRGQELWLHWDCRTYQRRTSRSSSTVVELFGVQQALSYKLARNSSNSEPLWEYLLVVES
jgi:hypothetical protein